MKITDNRTDRKVKFGTLNAGDTFVYEDQICMKIEEEKYYNAVSLSYKIIMDLDHDDVVTPVNCELVIS